MTIALIAHYLGPTLGIGQYLDRLIPPLQEELKRHNVETIILGSPNAIAKTPALNNLTQKIETLPSLDYNPTKRLIWFATSFSSYCKQKGITGVIWLSNPIVLPWHPPSIAVIHDVNEWKMQSKYGSYFKTALRSLIYLDSSLYFAKKIVAISQTTYKDILHFRPNLPIQEKLITISNGANSSLAQLPAVEINAPTPPFLLSVGRIDPASKNLPQAVNLTRALREKSGQPYSLHFIGGMNASSETEGKAFIKSIEEISWAVYHGYVDNNNLAQWYRTATAIVFLSDNEGFGFPIAEAASFQKWSIVSDKNQTAFEAGGEALIPINIDEPEKSVSEVLTKLKQGKPPTVELQSWETTAQLYSDLINEVLVN
jgi:glycosyltransferase involved in cell wall biosynthesis